jgi:pimeloyl-ACP methyl ester carboxylesterase
MAGSTAFEVHGEGPPIVLVHGLGLSRHMWQWQIDALTPHFKVVQYDLLGHGESPKPAGPYPMSHMVDQLAALMAELHIEQAALAGFSLGGLIVQAFALAHPQKVTALAILNAAHARTDEQRAGIMRRVWQAEESGPQATVDDALRRWFTDEFAAGNPQVLEQVRQWVTGNDASVYPALYRLLAEADIGLEDSIAGIDCPALVMTGEDDGGNSPQMAQQMAAKIPNARLAILPGLRHMALAEDPAAVNALLVPFFRDTLHAW